MLFVLAPLLTPACGGSSKSKPPPPPPNDPPEITAPSGLGGSGAIRTLTIETAGSDTIEFTATDPDGDTVQWLAQTTGGDAVAAGITFTSPVLGTSFEVTLDAVAEPAAAVLTLLVEDPRGAAAAFDLRVVRSGAPTILGVTPDSAFATRAQAVTITGKAFSLNGSVLTTASFDGVVGTGFSTIDDQTLKCSTPANTTPGPTVVAVSNAFGNSQLPDTAFTVFAFPPSLAANDAQLDAGNATAPCTARDGAMAHSVWVEGNDVVHRASTDGGATWSAAQPLSGGEVSSEPQVCVVGSDVVVAWIGDGNTVIVRTSHDGGASFAPAVTLDSGTPAQGPVLAASEARRHLAWRRGTTGLGTARIIATSSSDAGDTWLPPAPVGDGGANQYDHQLACSGSFAWIAFVDERDGFAAAGIYSTRTTNGGTSWASPHRRSLAGAAASAPQLCHDAGRVWIAWLRGGALEYVGSGDNGLSWPTVAYDLRSTGGAVTEPALACAGNRLHAIYVLGGNSVAVTRVGGIGTAPQHTTVSSVAGPGGEPTIASLGNYVVAVWRNGTVGGGTARLQTATSTDLGATFTAPSGFGDASAAQEAPQLSLSGARLLLTWLDHRTTPPGVFTNRTFQ
jgi:hypothetical protein